MSHFPSLSRLFARPTLPTIRRPEITAQDARITLPDGTAVTVVVDVGTDDPISQEVLSGTVANEFLLFLLGVFTKPGDRVLDLGSHIGTFSLTAAALGRHVLAVDANTKHIELLHRSRAANGLPNLHIAHAAVGNAYGVCQFEERGLYGCVLPGGAVAGENTRSVQLMPAADLVSAVGWDRLDFLKMDVEGSEIRAVAGMRELLAGPDAPAIIYESNAAMLEPLGGSMAELKRIFEGLGYTMYRMFGEQLVPVGPTSFLPEVWLDLVALKAKHREMARPYLRPPLTVDQLAQQIREWWAPRDSTVHRQFVARELQFAEPELRAHPMVIDSMNLLAADAEPDVRAAAAWWGRSKAAA